MIDQSKDQALAIANAAIEAAQADHNSGRAIVAAIESLKRIRELLGGAEVRVRSEKVAAKNWRAWIPGTAIEAFGPEKEQAEKFAREIHSEMAEADQYLDGLKCGR